MTIYSRLFTTGFVDSKRTEASPKEDNNWIIEHVSDHVLLSIPPIHIGGSHLIYPYLHILMMLISAVLMVIILTYAAAGNRKEKTSPKLGNFIEILILFVKDDIVIPSMGKVGANFLPFFLTLFFFILFMNFLGLIPFMHTASSNISVTAALALITFAMTQILGIKNNGFFGYFKGLVPHGYTNIRAAYYDHNRVPGITYKTVCIGYSSFCQHDSRPYCYPCIYQPDIYTWLRDNSGFNSVFTFHLPA